MASICLRCRPSFKLEELPRDLKISFRPQRTLSALHRLQRPLGTKCAQHRAVWLPPPSKQLTTEGTGEQGRPGERANFQAFDFIPEGGTSKACDFGSVMTLDSESAQSHAG